MNKNPSRLIVNYDIVNEGIGMDGGIAAPDCSGKPAKAFHGFYACGLGAKSRFIYALFVIAVFIIDIQLNAQGTWKAVKALAPDSAGGGMVLLTDGTVMVKGYSSNGWATPDSNWELLTPDIHGSYVN